MIALRSKSANVWNRKKNKTKRHSRPNISAYQLHTVCTNLTHRLLFLPLLKLHSPLKYEWNALFTCRTTIDFSLFTCRTVKQKNKNPSSLFTYNLGILSLKWRRQRGGKWSIMLPFALSNKTIRIDLKLNGANDNARISHTARSLNAERVPAASQSPIQVIAVINITTVWSLGKITKLE